MTAMTTREIDMLARTAMIATALAVTGCASVPPTRIASCNQHECHLVVTVTDCRVSVDPDSIQVMGRGRELHWDIDPASTGYTFPANGIFVKDYDPTREFSDPRRANQNTKFMLNDRNGFARDYAYGINVMKGSTACPTYDPWIINQG
jgi:hypothetical protein